MAATAQAPSSLSRLTHIRFAGVLLISAVYFADMFLKASHKCYWFDELFTVYLCRLPRFTDVWRAVLHGADFNPPLLYLFTRWAQSIFGQGLIATRLPAMVGVWLFGLCLFLFVERRAGSACGIVAGLFPFFTLAQYYAYEARAHGIMLGWCGLAMLCWQREAEGRRRYLWLAGFSLSLAGALLTHLYGVYLLVPFAVVELYNLCRQDRVNYSVLSAMFCAAAPVVAFIYLPLFRIYRATIPHDFFVPNREVLQNFLVAVFGPALSILLLAAILSGLAGFWQRRSARVTFQTRELLAAASFTLIPLLGFVGARISHGPFVDRYFLSSVAGVAIFLGCAMSLGPSGTRSAQVMAACLMIFIIGDLGFTVYQLAGSHALSLVEPSTKLVVSTTPSDPMQIYQTVSQSRDGQDVLVLPAFDYFYFVNYAPRTVVPRLYYAAADPRDMGLGLYSKLAQWAQIDFHTMTLDSFLAGHKNFLVYAGKDGGDLAALQAIASRGYRFVSAKGDAGGILYEYAK